MFPHCHYHNCPRSEEAKKNKNEGYLSESNEWFCSQRCFVEELADRTIERKKERRNQTIWKMQLGLLLLKRNLIDQEKLNHALIEKNRSGRRVGEILVDSGHISENELKRALSIQAGVAPITIDPANTVYLLEDIPERVYLFFNMTVFNVNHDERIIYVAVSDVQDLSYLKFFFDTLYNDYLIKFYLDTPAHVAANLSHAIGMQGENSIAGQNRNIPIKEQLVDTVILNFLQFLDRLGGKNTKVDHLDQALWVRSELEGHQVDIYLTPKG